MKNLFIYKKGLFILSAVLVVGAILFSHAFESRAAGTLYYFNNAVDTNPSTLGNYWYDDAFTDPALELPDLSVDELHIASGATYDGDATFNQNGVNLGIITGDAIFKDSSVNNDDGIVNGDATFVGDLSETFGKVLGDLTRLYENDITTTRDFQPYVWTVVADGAVVDVSGASVYGSTIFTTNHGGSFVYGIPTLVKKYFYNGTIVLGYNKPLDTSSVPVAADFDIEVNGEVINISDISISGKEVSIMPDDDIDYNDTILVDYTQGGSPIQTDDGGLAANLTNVRVLSAIPSGDTPSFFIVAGTKGYSANTGDTVHPGTVTIINLVDNTVIDTLQVGVAPQYMATVNGKIYVINSESDSVSVIDGESNEVIETINVGGYPYQSIAVGTKIYVPNEESNTVSVIDSDSDTVVETISAGEQPYSVTSVGTKLYVLNSSGSDVTVVDTITDTVIDTVSVGGQNYYAASAGPYVYVNNSGDGTVSVIDTTDDTIDDTIIVGDGPIASVVVGNKLYVANRNTNTVSVINTDTNIVSETIMVGDSPVSPLYFDGRVYVINQSSDTISVIDIDSDTVVDTLDSGDHPFYGGVFESTLYVVNTQEDIVSLINTQSLPSLLPNLTSFTTSSASGTYGVGQAINITANFGRQIQAGSTMTVLLSTNRSVVLSNVSGSTLSGTYTIQTGDTTPDLVITAITSASVTDTDANTRTSYGLPSSTGNFEGENSFITRNLGDTKNIQIGEFANVTVGEGPYQMSTSITIDSVPYIYVANQGDNSVSVINLNSYEIVDTINVGEEPYGLANVSISGTVYIYVANINSNDVSVINTSTNNVVETIDVGVKPYYVAAVGTSIYVTNGGSNTVSVINANTRDVTDTIPVGSYPRGIKAHGTDLYVANYGDPNYPGGDYVSVIDSNTNTVTDTIVLPLGSTGPRGIAVLADKVYSTNYRSHNVSVIDTATNAIVDTVNVGTGPRGITGRDTTVYVENFDEGTLSIIDTNTNTVSDTVDIGHSPAGIVLINSDAYISSFQDGKVRILDTDTNTLLSELVITDSDSEEPQTSGGGGSSGSYARPRLVAPVILPSIVPSVSCHVFVTFMHRGSKFGEVLSLQTRLNTLGFNTGIVDGLYGPKTQAAVKDFQSAHGIVRAGYVGPATRAALNQSCKI